MRNDNRPEALAGGPVRNVMRLGYDGELSVGRYVEIVRVAKAEPAGMFRRSFMGFWPTDGREILRQFRLGVHDRINAHLPENPKGWGRERFERKVNAHGLRSECRWCGRGLPKWSASRETHFCDSGCRRDFYS